MYNTEHFHELVQHLSPEVGRCFYGPEAAELHLLIHPEDPGADLITQVQGAYKKLNEALRLEEQVLKHVVRETIYFRDIERDLGSFVSARKSILGKLGALKDYQPASSFVGQPPLENGALLGIIATAVSPYRPFGIDTWNYPLPSACSCDACENVNIRVLLMGDQKHIFAGNVVGSPGNAYDEAYSLFRSTNELLQSEQTDCMSLVRTWIYLRDMEQDYAEFNRARRDFFREVGITTPPASTGISGMPFVPEHRFSLGFHAIKSHRLMQIEPMTTPTLIEAPEYGSDFSRGMKIVDANKITLYVSGTASVDENGNTAHTGDLESQAKRMLLNVSTLLEKQGASWRDVVSASTYLKHSEHVVPLLRIYRKQGIEGFPHALLKADICRPELLCEMEVTALLARSGMEREDHMDDLQKQKPFGAIAKRPGEPSCNRN